VRASLECGQPDERDNQDNAAEHDANDAAQQRADQCEARETQQGAASQWILPRSRKHLQGETLLGYTPLIACEQVQDNIVRAILFDKAHSGWPLIVVAIIRADLPVYVVTAITTLALVRSLIGRMPHAYG
jgi:hypothetical protein